MQSLELKSKITTQFDNAEQKKVQSPVSKSHFLKYSFNFKLLFSFTLIIHIYLDQHNIRKW